MKKIVLVPVVFVFILIGIFWLGDRVLGLNNFENFKSEIKDKLKQSEEKKEAERPLDIEVLGDTFETIESTAEIVVKANKEIFEDSNRMEVIFVSEDSDYKYYVLKVSNLEIGESTVKVSIRDELSESEDFEIKVIRKAYTLPLGLKEIEPWPGSLYTLDGDNLLALVNKDYKIVKSYKPTDLVDLNKDYLLYTNSTKPIMLRREAADALRSMLQELKKDTGEDLIIASGYRSYNEQVEIYSGWLRDMGQVEADKVSARPGFSEHHLGTVVDFVTKDTNYSLENSFKDTKAGKWLNENAYKFGFVKSYPEGKESVTGYSTEEWHWRYIGFDSADQVRLSGKTLKEWLEEKN